MKLADHTDFIRKKIEQAFINKLGRLGIISEMLKDSVNLSFDDREERGRMVTVLEVFIKETGTKSEGYHKLVEELTFTFFNRLAALKVMEAHVLLPEIITRRREHGDRSFAHLAWLEQHPEGREMEAEGISPFLENQLELLSREIPLFNLHHPFHLMPTAIELLGIIQSFNQVELDSEVADEIWQSDDVLGWLYESYNNDKKKRHKDEGGKTEYNKVSIQSQVYTPKWVVKFLVDNSLGKLYLEMYPDSDIRKRYKIANAPKERSRTIKPLTEIKLIDPSNGSGNFLLYAFDLYYDLYIDQIENYDAEYDKKDIPKLIIENNLYGVDLDDRAVQLAQFGLYIKAKRKKRNIQIEHFNVVSSDFFLPDYEVVREMFEGRDGVPERHSRIFADLWEDLQNAYKFGSLIRLEEKMNLKWFGTKSKAGDTQITMFVEENLEEFENFRIGFFNNLSKAIAQNTAKEGQTFLNTKTQDAITFLQVLTQKYDVAVSNPPYTDSADFGSELKKFVEGNYKKPYKFNTNLYATFIKRCYELIGEKGKMALIHPLTFMYIKSFEDVRKFILEKTSISLFVDYGLSNLFGTVMVDPAFYVLEKDHSKKENSLFVSLDQYTRTPNEKFKKEICLTALDDYLIQTPNKHNIILPQEKLKVIEGQPFIYWISDGFREKFKEKTILDIFKPAQGAATTNNNRFLRFWWEIGLDYISFFYEIDQKRWVLYSKGGPFNKWYGNMWVALDWKNAGKDLSKVGAVLRNSNFYFKEGITYSASGSKGASYRVLPKNCIFDTGGSSIFATKIFQNIPYLTAFLNSPLASYIIDCLNPTVNTQVGDIQRVPFVIPLKELENLVSDLASQNIQIKKNLCSFRIVETNFKGSPLFAEKSGRLKEKVHNFIDYENLKYTQILINESIITNSIFEVYELSIEDRNQVEAKMGKPIGSLPILEEAKESFINQLDELLDVVSEHMQGISISEFDDQQVREIMEGLSTLYQSNNDLEEFCNRHQVNPINVWYWFRNSKILPQGRAHEITLEFLADAIRTIINLDEDGIIPLVGLPGEPRLLDRLEEYCINQGFTSAQFMQLDGLLGKPINEYLEDHFFKNLGDHLNLFMYLPKTPFIWHLSSGPSQGFEAYIIIYKWNRDSLFRLKSQYISKRVESLEYRQLSLQDVNTAQSMNERELIIKQLDEIEKFSKKVDELIDEGYDPVLDSGVGKNIAPLQKKGMLRAEVLKDKQLEKYLNADW